MKSLLTEALPFLIIGILFYTSKNYLLLSAVLSALFLLFIFKNKRYIFTFAIFFMILGIVGAKIHTDIFNNTYSMLQNKNVYEGYILEKNKNTLTLRNNKEKYTLIASSYKNIDAVPGDYIIINAKLKPKPEYKKCILNSMEIDAYANISKVVSQYKTNKLFLVPYKIKHKINDVLCSINKPGGAFISGLISGYTRDMSYEDKDNFNNLGISHILAVSGFNLGIIYFFIRKLLRGLAAKTRYTLTILICFIYTLFAGFEPSITRAFIMILIATMAKILNRYYDILNGISLSAIIMLTYNPFYIYNLGFILSFLATYGIILFQKEIQDIIPDKVSIIKEETATTLAALIPSFPIILWARGYFSVISIMVNVIIAPLISIATISAFISTVIYILLPFKFILYPSVFIGVVFVKLAQILSSINILVFTGQPHPISIVIYLLIIATYFGYIKFKISRKNIKILYGVMILCLTATFIFHGNSLKIHILNIGQGDSIFIETPKKHSILIDTGPAFKDYIAAQDRVIPYIRKCGYNKIDMLIITHFHNDHAGGLNYILNHIKVGKIIVYKSPKYLKKYNVYEVEEGNIIDVDSTKLNVLEPEESIINQDDKNETCLIMRLNYKNFSALFTADAEKEIMDKLSGKYDILKVQHHGSVHSFSEEMIDNSSIGAAVISVGKNNFGHPSPRVIEYLLKKNINIYRTDTDGNITITTYGSGYKVLFN